MAELTLEEAREIYKKSDELKEMMLGKFSKEELEKDMQYADSGIEKLPSIQVKMKYDISLDEPLIVFLKAIEECKHIVQKYRIDNL
jgi:hypothetical protein